MSRRITHRTILISLLTAFYALAVAGCSGILFGNSGKYYQCRLSDDIHVADIRTVGVYAFSDGMFFRASPLSGNLYSDRVTQSSRFFPDTSNTMPSLALAEAIRGELDKRGYSAKVATGLGHSKVISVEDCLANARSNGYDALFITYYTGICPWGSYAKSGTIYSAYDTDDSTMMQVLTSEGYLYIPNSAFIDARTGDILWSNSYYGLVQYAHVPNLSNEPFNLFARQALDDSGAESYLAAAKKAITNIFDPPLWRESFREFPVRGEKRKRL